jgi:hypothetical protein
VNALYCSLKERRDRMVVPYDHDDPLNYNIRRLTLISQTKLTDLSQGTILAISSTSI